MRRRRKDGEETTLTPQTAPKQEVGSHRAGTEVERKMGIKNL